MRNVVAGILACCSLHTAAAKTPVFKLTPVATPETENLAVAAVNDSGVMTGLIYDQLHPGGYGFYGKLGDISLFPELPDPNKPTPIPSGINNDGTIIGFYFISMSYTFVLRNSQYFIGIGQGQPAVPIPPYIGPHNHLVASPYQGHGIYSMIIGTPAEQHPFTVHNGEFPSVTSINASGQVAGEFTSFDKAGDDVRAIFLHRHGLQGRVLPPKAQSAHGGWLNDGGQVAGAYQDEAYGWHGFVYYNGSYTSFDLPTTPTSLTVQGIDERGRVAGVYADASGQQYGFIYANGVVNRFGAFPTSDIVHVSISHAGKHAALSATTSDRAASLSYLITCAPKSAC